jgi:glucose-1-phosphate cytidylyltransferase
MQVVILCGGQGTRIRDVTEDLPKPMLPIGGRPILWHIMKGFAHQGFNHFILCLGYKSWVIKRFFLDYHLQDSDFTIKLGGTSDIDVHHCPTGDDWRVTMVETGLESMTGCRVKRIEPYVTGDHFHLTYGDGLADVDLLELQRFHYNHGKVGTVTVVRAPSRFGEIELRGPRVIDFSEKPAITRGRINGGFFVFRRDFFDRLQDDPGLVLETVALPGLAGEGELMAFAHDGFWQPMDTSREFRSLNDLWARDQAPWKTWDRPLSCRAAA